MLFPRGVVAADGPTVTTQQREVMNVSEAWRDALNHRDIRTFALYIADDFIGSTDDGILMTKARLLKRLATHSAEQEQRSDVRDVRVHIGGDSAIVNYLTCPTEGGFESKPVSFQLRRTEFFQKRDGAWLAIAAHERQVLVNHRVSVKIDPRTLQDYVGQYTWRPGFPATYTVEAAT
jgi:ketosteroid isomerase-like protein